MFFKYLTYTSSLGHLSAAVIMLCLGLDVYGEVQLCLPSALFIMPRFASADVSKDSCVTE